MPHLLTPQPVGLVQCAAAAMLPVLALRRMRHLIVHTTLQDLNLDLVCVACWPWRIPPALLALPRLGWLNSHPALLPALRGPAPLAEALQRGMRETGVTIHWMDAGFDTGDITLQAPLPLAEGMRLDEAEEQAAVLGAQLMAEALMRLRRDDLPRRAQR
jgi:methionyl-tRNA formyltransferase